MTDRNADEDVDGIAGTDGGTPTAAVRADGGGQLATMEPTPTWNAAAHEEAVATLAADGLVFRVWGGDWCSDCRGQLPDFAAALAAAEVPDERIHHYPVEKRADGSKRGPLVEEYGIELIPTVVVERDGSELARFVESAPVPIAAALAESLHEAGVVPSTE